jgi:hypothetical protein
MNHIILYYCSQMLFTLLIICTHLLSDFHIESDCVTLKYLFSSMFITELHFFYEF